MNGFITCKWCCETKNACEFYDNSRRKNGKFSHCKKCHAQYVKDWRKSNLQRKKHHQRNSTFKIRYGINVDRFNEMVNHQNNKCLICNEMPKKTKSFQTWNLHVDHCHISGKVRGLLCHLCNRGIGLFRERMDLLEKAFKYLKKHS